MGLLDLIAPGNPISPFLDQNRSNLVSGFAGMVGAGNDPRAALKGFAQGVQQNIPVQQRMQLEQQERAEKQAQIDLQHQQQNATIAFLQKKYPDLAAAASNGVPLADVYSEMWKRETGGGAGQESWYGNLVPVKDAQGNVTYAQVSNRGGFKPIDVPQGMTPLSPVQQLNTGTAFTGVDKFGNPTGSSTPINNQGAAFDTAVGKGFGENILDARSAATDAQGSLRATQEARKLLDSGVITGFGADFKVGMGKALQQVGINLAPDAIANTEAFVATRAQEVGRLIKMFGAGTGLSDADREFATKAAAGSIEMNEESIRRILDINERAAKAVIENYNTMVSPIGSGQMPNLSVGQGQASASDPLGIR